MMRVAVGGARMRLRKLAGIGHSHLSCFQRAHAAQARAGAAVWPEASFLRLNQPALQPNFRTGPDRSRHLTEEVTRRIAHFLRRGAPDAILLAAMGNEYNGLALLQHPEPFDVPYPGEPDLDPARGGMRIPRALMAAQMRLLADRNVLMFWRHVDAVAGAPVFVVPPPPPIASTDHILSHPGAFGERARRFGVAPAVLRRKLWRIYCDTIAAAIAAEGRRSVFLALPAAVFEDGFLARRFWQGDPTHANEAYGALMLGHLAAVAGAVPAAEGALP